MKRGVKISHISPDYIPMPLRVEQTGKTLSATSMVDLKAKVKELTTLDPEKVSARMLTTKIANRNDPCPCKSGKKYKKCCAAKETLYYVEVPAVAFRK